MKLSTDIFPSWFALFATKLVNSGENWNPIWVSAEKKENSIFISILALHNLHLFQSMKMKVSFFNY
jgi:hypothetical protein